MCALRDSICVEFENRPNRDVRCEGDGRTRAEEVMRRATRWLSRGLVEFCLLIWMLDT